MNKYCRYILLALVLFETGSVSLSYTNFYDEKVVALSLAGPQHYGTP